MKTKDVSFIIPVYNRPDEVKELLDSFLKLQGNKDFEIVIVEDGSVFPISKKRIQVLVILETMACTVQRALISLYWILTVYYQPSIYLR